MMVKQKIEDFILKNFDGFDASGKICEHDDLIERGILDSMGLMKTITFMEEQFGIHVSDDDVLPENFQTINSIHKLVERLSSQSSLD